MAIELRADEQDEQPQDNPPERVERDTQPWRALWAMMIGFFMILVDSTIVAVANPRIMEKLDTDYDAVIWVTSAYLLAYAVPLLVAGRLGDRFGPKNLYLIGLAIFTAASLWCGLAGSIEMLIAARVVQGLGAALLTPQTLSTITRIFPPERRGVAMSVWGATAGVATLVGPLAGGALVDSLGWQWIFFVNVPVGVVGIALAVWLIPVLPTHRHRFDMLGVVLSGDRDVPDRVRPAGGPVASLVAVDLGHDRGRCRGDGCLRVLAVGQQTRAADPAARVSRPRLLDVERRCCGDGLHRGGRWCCR